MNMAPRKAKYVVGIDVGGTKMMTVLFNQAGTIVGRTRQKNRSGSVSVTQIVQCVHETIADAKITQKQIVAIGMGLPGLLDIEAGIIRRAPNLGWENMPIRRRLHKAFGCRVVIMNDVDAGVYGEYRFGAAKNARCVVGIFAGTGIGGGCIYEGKIIRGRKYSCMEIGHVPVIPEGLLCGCGRRGCLETVAGRPAIAAAAAQAAYRGAAPHLFDNVGADLSKIRSSALAAAIKAGDLAIERIVTEAARWIGLAAGNLINLLSPDVILLGGGLVEAMPQIFRETVAATANQSALSSFKGTFTVRVASLGDDATATGAAAWAIARESGEMSNRKQAQQ
jgi:glucokinase